MASPFIQQITTGTSAVTAFAGPGQRLYELYVCPTCQKFHSAEDLESWFPPGEVRDGGINCKCTDVGTPMRFITVAGPLLEP